MVYLTGGVAFARFKMDIANGRSQVALDSVGVTIGGGLEFAISERWSLRSEYLKISFGKQRDIADVSISGIFDANTGDYLRLEDVDIFRVAVSYRFAL